MTTPDEMLELETAAYQEALDNYNRAKADGVPEFLLYKPQPPQLRLPRPMTPMQTPFTARKWKRNS